MRVARVIESFFPYISGPANQALQISKQLKEIGIESPIFSTFFGVQNVKSKETYEGIDLTRFHYKRRIMKYLYTPQLRKELNKNFDGYHGHSYRSYQSALAYDVAKKKNKFYAINTHGSLLGYTELRGVPHLPYKMYDILSRKRYILDADAVVVSASIEKEEALRFGVEEDKIHVIPAGIDKINFSRKHAERRIELLTVGRISRSRRIEMLIKALDHISVDARLTIVGPEKKRSDTEKGGYLKELKQLAKGKNVRFIGELRGDALLNVYREADVFLYASEYENFGQCILSAAQFKMPIITTKVGIALDLIKDGTSGFFANSIEDFADRIDKLGDITLRKKISEEISVRVSKDFEWKNIGLRYKTLYSEL